MQAPKNVILVIGDGMGFESVRAASVFATGEEKGLSFQSFPHQAQMTTENATGDITDSAASATAMATGVKVNNLVLSLRIPGDQEALPTLLEYYKSRGRRIGLVTTSYVEDATTAAFAAHENHRSRLHQIAEDYAQRSQPDVVMGGYTPGAFDPDLAYEAGYTVVTDRAGLQRYQGSLPLAGLFAEGQMPFEFDGDYSSLPDLSEMTEKALELLSAHPQGFFLLVENENIDESGHGNHIQRHTAATVELSETVQSILDWAGDRDDTLIIVTTDHETGGLSIVPQGKGKFPQASWSTTRHTDTLVPIYAKGPRASEISGTMDNTDFVRVVTGDSFDQL